VRGSAAASTFAVGVVWRRTNNDRVGAFGEVATAAAAAAAARARADSGRRRRRAPGEQRARACFHHDFKLASCQCLKGSNEDDCNPNPNTAGDLNDDGSCRLHQAPSQCHGHDLNAAPGRVGLALPQAARCDIMIFKLSATGVRPSQ
jgi:hypothetical protein